MVHFEQLALVSQASDCNKLGVILVVHLKGNSPVITGFFEKASIIDFFASRTEGYFYLVLYNTTSNLPRPPLHYWTRGGQKLADQHDITAFA